jgi:hypothetical protein
MDTTIDTTPHTTKRTPLAIAGRILLGLAVTAAAGIHAFFWLLVAGFQCDESCEGTSWHSTPGAWQWSAMGALGFASFVLAVAFAIALSVRRSPHWLTIGLAAATVATAIAPWVIGATG